MSGINQKIKDLIFIISGPSGSGKGTVIDMLIEKIGCRKAVSVTTRAKRPGEINGRDYYFIDRMRFDEMVKNGALLEYNIYGGNGYGTPRREVDDALKNGTKLILDVDVNGAANIAKIYPEIRRVFVIPPCASEQRKRLENRGTNTPEQIEKRMNITLDELKFWETYDCVVINQTGCTGQTAAKIISVMNGDIPDQKDQKEVSILIENYFKS